MEFGPIKALAESIMIPMLQFCYDNIIANYGIAIILVTILIKALFYPLTQKQYTSMKAMQDINPQLQTLKEKHKDSPQKLQSEMMALYKKHGVNPLSGCLPMIVQIPFFLAIYSTIMGDTFKAMIHAPGINPGFLPFWITNLSVPDSTWVLPVVLAGFTYWSQKLIMVDPAQKKFLLLSPIMILVFGLRLPSGVLLYWAVSTILSTVQQFMALKPKKQEIIKA
jgi:YidC/Oxa1 family membrane protein insertase